MKRLLTSKIQFEDELSKSPNQQSRPTSCRKDSFNKIQISEQRKSIRVGVVETTEPIKTTKEDLINLKEVGKKKKEYYNRFSLERINFTFEEYRNYPDDYFLPSVFFFKFLCVKPDYEGKIFPKLRLYIPDTILYNDSDSNYWVYTDVKGYVRRTETFSDSDILEKFRSANNDEEEILAVSKTPNYKGDALEDNILEVLNNQELERYIYSKNSNTYALQKFIKCRGPKAFVCRTVWQRNKPAFIYILTNKANYIDNIRNQNLKFVINSKETNSYSPFYATSGKHLDETLVYLKNIIQFVERHSDLILDELVGDFIK